ncbi:MAG: response regulator [Desulfobulbaceae bacterium]|nr:response regulator [Desulfobulbaceae bacterium]MCK5437718.1 response regulator [Desulfobulbaceae bacterium]
MAASDKAVPQDRSFTIIIIEDSRFQAEFLKQLLTETAEGLYEIDCAGRLNEGLRLISDRQYDLLILDLNLPDSKGLETMKSVQRQNRDLAIVLNTGINDEKLAIEALRRGAQDYLIKGEPPHRIVQSIRYALERKRILERLKESQSQVMQQEKMASIGQLAAGVAHEINNPIGFISSNLSSLTTYFQRFKEFIEFQSNTLAGLNDSKIDQEIAAKRKALKLDYLLEDVGDLIKESLEGTERVKEIVLNLKSFSRVDERKYIAADINECLDSTLNIVWNELKYKAKVEKDYGDIKAIKCFPQQLNQVFMNLLVNAAHAIEKEGTISIKTRQNDEFIYVSISDTGRGIPPEHLSRIFDPFFTTKKAGEGTGLGLSIVYDIVRKTHKGDITVDSEVGKGTTFTIKLPVT